MSGLDLFRYDGRRALVVGGATGMGAAAAQLCDELGAEVVVMDCAPVDHPVGKVIKVDLRDRDEIDRALDEAEGPFEAVFSASGIAGGPGVMKVNFIAHRYIIERLIDAGRLPAGSAICMISSVAGLGWEAQMPALIDFLDTPPFDAASAWVDAHDGTDNYGFAKQAMNCYVAQQAYPLLAKGIRINAICPGPTDTPLARANAETWLTFAQDYRNATGSAVLTAAEMGQSMVFLNSAAASGISGVNMLVDRGHVMSSLTESWQAGAPMIKMLMGRS
jgi:NAD(P)-dependent dehydrogenase (short-subunit alcohol dehydrogenase family)